MAANHPTLRARVIDTEHDGFLTAETARAGRPRGADVWVYMCGPLAMTTALSDGFRGLGIPASRVRFEQFDIREDQVPGGRSQRSVAGEGQSKPW